MEGGTWRASAKAWSMKVVSLGRELVCRWVWTVWKAERIESSRAVLWLLEEGMVVVVVVVVFSFLDVWWLRAVVS